MKFLVYSQINASHIQLSLGLPEYSYYFVLKDFLPVLQILGTVQIVNNPVLEVDALYDAACATGELCVFLSFSPPHKTFLDLRCPTIPVFAWEFSSIPNEYWLDELHQDWRYVLTKCGRGITHSGHTVKAVKAELGDSFPITSIPSPVWDKFEVFRKDLPKLPIKKSLCIQINTGLILDTHDISLEPYMPDTDAVANAVAAARGEMTSVFKKIDDSVSQNNVSTNIFNLIKKRCRYLVSKLLHKFGINIHSRKLFMRMVSALPIGQLEPVNQVEPKTPSQHGIKPITPTWSLQPCKVSLSGVVFTSLFNPYDGRKNWVDMLTAFCAAFKDIPDATLVFKLGHHEYQSAINDMLMCMARMPKFKCRVVLIQGFLNAEEFDNLISSTAFIVNASHGEGQCLPLMEFLSCGKPAIAPRHSAMLDYINSDLAFIVNIWLDATAWSHDPRLAYRTLRHQIDWSSLVDCYKSAYHCALNEPERYAKMSHTAIERMQNHCSRKIATKRLEEFLHTSKAIA